MADSFPAASGGASGSFPAGTPSPEPAPAGGETVLFGRYKVLRELGRGGMGVVLLAEDTALDLKVAVKLIPDMVVKDTEAIGDLRKEVLRGMALTHPGVVRTYHFERDATGAAVIMEYVEGWSLTEKKLEQLSGCFDPAVVLPGLEQICSVLDYAQARGAVRRLAK